MLDLEYMLSRCRQQGTTTALLEIGKRRALEGQPVYLIVGDAQRAQQLRPQAGAVQLLSLQGEGKIGCDPGLLLVDTDAIGLLARELDRAKSQLVAALARSDKLMAEREEARHERWKLNRLVGDLRAEIAELQRYAMPQGAAKTAAAEAEAEIAAIVDQALADPNRPICPTCAAPVNVAPWGEHFCGKTELLGGPVPDFQMGMWTSGPNVVLSVNEAGSVVVAQALEPETVAATQLDLTAEQIADGACPAVPGRGDGQHCEHWWDGDQPCCNCGDNSEYDPGLEAAAMDLDRSE